MLGKVKKEIIKAISQLKIDDKAYLYKKDEYLTCRKGQAIAQVANYIPQEFSIPKALKETVVVTGEDDRAKKHIFVILDKDVSSYSVGQTLKYNSRQYQCNVYFCVFKPHNLNFEANLMEVSDLSNFIISKT